MQDRRRLLVFSILILLTVSLSSVALTSYHFHQAALAERAAAALPHHTATATPREAEPPYRLQQSDFADDAYRRAGLLAIAETLVIVIAGGTLLVRASNPFMWRLEQSEAHTRAILNTAGDGILTVDHAGRIESFNLAAARMFDLPHAIGEPIGRLLCVENAGAIQPAELAVPTVVNHLMANTELLGRRSDGTTFPVELSMSEVNLGERHTLSVIIRDVTDRRAVEAQTERHMRQLQEIKEHLEAKAAQLAKTNRELDDFTHVASHDLKEPLRGISSYCQILLEDYQDKLDADGQRRLAALVSLCQRLGQLIDDLLSYSRIGRSQPDEQQTDLGDLVEEVLETLGPAIDQRNGVVRVLGTLPTVRADRTMLFEVLSNLIANGLKFNDNPTPTVEIGAVEIGAVETSVAEIGVLEAGTLGAAQPTLFVRDNGIGIATEHHEAVFTMFRRLHSRRKYEGTGAGLSIVRKIIEAHGGRVWVESEPGCGATFYFTLPAEPVPAEHLPGGDIPAENHCALQELATCAAG